MWGAGATVDITTLISLDIFDCLCKRSNATCDYGNEFGGEVMYTKLSYEGTGSNQVILLRVERSIYYRVFSDVLNWSEQDLFTRG